MWWQTLSDKTKALILSLLIITGSVIAAWILSGWQLALLIATVQLAVVFMAKHIWMSDKSNFLLRGVVLTIVSGVVLLGNSWWQPLVSNLVHQYYPNLPLPDYSVSPITLLFLLILVTIVFRYTKSEPVVERPEKKITDLIKEPSIKQKWESICENLSHQIRDIDTATNWSHEYYTPLDAEVEMKTSKGTRKVVKDLLEAIKESEDRLFLLIGDPGAGKSVALRKLCLDILKESVQREYIPIYVNLKEWTTKSDWSKTPPKWEDLEAFVKQSLMDKNRYLGDFFEQYYHILDENGNLFFVLDSFDEIPQVLGTTADAKLIEDLSKVCREFLQGAKQKRSKGILASREYRMPREEYFGAKTTLRVRPFSFEKIEQSLTQSGKITKATVEQLLRERPELVPNLRNPFITSLLKAYLADNKNRFPKNQADLFENYIHTSIQKAQARSGREDLALEEILSVTTQIAKIIFSEAGLQAPLSMLRQKVQHPAFDSIVEIMRYTRIARGDANNTAHFSFAHRRFYEYFVVQDLLHTGKADLPLENIPTDSKWRDTLVLYCEVAPFEEAQRIANYCWFDVILPNNDIRNRASKHCLRFLTEAFRGRQECLVDFHEALGEYVLSQIHVDNDPIDIKLAVEALSILSVENLDKGAIMSLKFNDSWINDTAIRSCRHLATISEGLEQAIVEALFLDISKKEISEISFRRQLHSKMSRSELIFSFRLSNIFEEFIPLVTWYNKEKKYELNLLKFSTLIIIMILFLMIKDFNRERFFMNLFFCIFITVFMFIAIMLINLHIIIPILRGFYLKGNKYYEKFYNIISVVSQIQNFVVLFILLLVFSGVFGIIMWILKFFIVDPIKILIYIPLYILPLYLLVSGIFQLREFLKNREIYLSIESNDTYDRRYIQNMFKKLSDSPMFLGKFLTNLENNVKQSHGIFSDGFLKVGQSQEMTRLIQLEERWREAEEREAEQQNIPKPKPSPKVEKTIKDLVQESTLDEAIALALKKPNLSKDDEMALTLLQSRLALLEREKNEGTIGSEVYHARLTELKKALLNLSDELSS